MDRRLTPSGPDIVFEEFDGDIVVLNLSSGRYFGFNPSAAVVWETLMAGCCPADIKAAMGQSDGLDEFVAALGENNLTVADAAPPAPVGAALGEKLAGIATAPMLEVYDDLADLIVADPIHDTDESRGWPVRPLEV